MGQNSLQSSLNSLTSLPGTCDDTREARLLDNTIGQPQDGTSGTGTLAPARWGHGDPALPPRGNRSFVMRILKPESFTGRTLRYAVLFTLFIVVPFIGLKIFESTQKPPIPDLPWINDAIAKSPIFPTVNKMLSNGGGVLGFSDSPSFFVIPPSTTAGGVQNHKKIVTGLSQHDTYASAKGGCSVVFDPVFVVIQKSTPPRFHRLLRRLLQRDCR